MRQEPLPQERDPRHQRRVRLVIRFCVLLQFRLSQRLTHGRTISYLLAFSRNLGRVELVNLEWKYDHTIDPLDLMKVCVLMCSDDVYLKNVTVKAVHARNKAQ